ncbi:MAG: SDR family NAD(P)-dependent oxidoreductase, partial [Clostridia bacterium]|nr:SDR family NAD(P)-dependent oxidoreductase [Clostridia bacterium]
MKTYIITGANSGLGFETAKRIAKKGYRVILACRNMEKGSEAADAIKSETGNENI